MRNGCCGTDAGKELREVTILLKWDELKYDIENGGYVEGDLLNDKEAVHVKHLMQDVCAEGNIDRVRRVLHLGYAECVEFLYGFTKEVIGEEGYKGTNKEEGDVDLVFELRVPVTISVTTVELLKHLMHEYLVCRVLADWMSVVYPEMSVKWAEKQEDAKRKTVSLLTHRMKRVRRRMSPF